jgi:hypothetical protein
MKVKDFLTPENWTKCASARDKSGNVVCYADSEAVCFCLLGAIGKCYGGIHELTTKPLREVLTKRDIKETIAFFNDMSTFEEVMSVVEEADI